MSNKPEDHWSSTHTHTLQDNDDNDDDDDDDESVRRYELTRLDNPLLKFFAQTDGRSRQARMRTRHKLCTIQVRKAGMKNVVLLVLGSVA